VVLRAGSEDDILFEIPLIALAKQLEVQCEGSLESGLMTVGCTAVKEVKIRNTGKSGNSGRISFIYNLGDVRAFYRWQEPKLSQVSLDPVAGVLDVGQVIAVKVRIQCQVEIVFSMKR
jgi:CO dehydrogenase/acetyl-CoA synthase delta subunit